MPRRNFIPVQLPPMQPDRCIDCPLLGLVPKGTVGRPKRSRKTRVCLGTMKALTAQGSEIRASARDSHHPLHRPCDNYWKAWMQLPRQQFSVSIQAWNECRIPYEQTLQLKIDFSD